MFCGTKLQNPCLSFHACWMGLAGGGLAWHRLRGDGKFRRDMMGIAPNQKYGRPIF
jgi:hypothetical protein